MIDRTARQHETECGPERRKRRSPHKCGQAAEQHREHRKQDTGSDSFVADEP
jgi:hypothetical protein